MRRPPLVVVFVGLVLIALGETAGALMSQLRPQLAGYARARVAANPQAHGLAGSAEYDAEVTARAVYTAEAGLSFFHTHAQGLGPLVIFAGTVAATTVRWRLARGAVAALLGLRALPAGLSRLLDRGARARTGRRHRDGGALRPHAARQRRHHRPRRARGAHGGGPRPGSGPVTPTPSDVWRRPPLATLVAAILLIACAEVGGASMARFKLELARGARAVMLSRPAVHGLVGVRDVDEQIIDEALVKFDAGLRLFHLHAEGMGLVIIATTMTAATLVQSVRARRAIILLLTVGGAAYPFGYLLWSALIPYHGIQTGKAVAELVVWIPFGGATIVAAWWLVALVGARLVRRT